MAAGSPYSYQTMQRRKLPGQAANPYTVPNSGYDPTQGGSDSQLRYGGIDNSYVPNQGGEAPGEAPSPMGSPGVYPGNGPLPGSPTPGPTITPTSGSGLPSPSAPEPPYQPQDPGTQGRPTRGNYSSPGFGYTPDWGTYDPGEMDRQNRLQAINTGQGLMGQFGGDRNYYGAASDYYGEQADKAFNGGEGLGYTPDESTSITREGQIMGGVAGSGQYDQLGPTAEEEKGIRGDPNSEYNYFTPDMRQNMLDINTRANSNSNTDIGAAGQDFSNAYSDEADRYRAAIDPTKLSQSGDYKQALKDAINKKDLTQSADFVNRYRMTPEQQQDIVNQTASNVGTQTQAQKDSIFRSGAASGNASPLAIAAAEDRANLTGERASADAIRGARIDASNTAAGREKNIEDERLGASQAYAGLASTAATQAEQQRLAAEQFQTGAGMQAAKNLGDASRSTTGVLLNSRLNNEQNNQKAQTGTAQYITNTGTGIAKDVDTAAANRNAQLYSNRANLGQYKIGNTYTQNMGANQFLSGANKAVGDTRIAGQTGYRKYLTDQNSQYLGANQNAGQQQLQTVATTGNQQNTAAGQAGDYKLNNPTAGDKAIGAITGFLKGI